MRYIVFALVMSVMLFANEYVTKESPYSVAKTMQRFQSIIEAKGFIVFAKVDHQKNAQSVGLKMEANKLLIFGNPKGGTLLMQKDPHMGIELPLKVLVYAQKGKTYISYKKPMAWVKEHKALLGHPVIKKVTQGMDKLTDAAIK